MGALFILGSQRSGTTLLSMVLGSHPEITSLDEPFSYALKPCICGSVCNACRWAKKAGIKQPSVDTQHCCHKVPKWTQFADQLRTRFPSAKLIFIHRNPLDIVSSMMTLKHKGSTWAATEPAAEITEMLSLTPNPRMSQEFARIVEDPLRMSLLCVFLKHQFAGGCNLQLSYEHLVERPAETCKMMCEYLNIAWDENMLKHHNRYIGWQIGQTDGQRPIDNRSVDVSHRRLTKEQVEHAQLYWNHLESLKEETPLPLLQGGN